jgi:hypothetical protein
MRPRCFAAVLIAALAGGCGGSEPPPAAQPPTTAPSEPAPTTTAPPPEPPEAKPKPRPGLPAYTAGYGDWRQLTRKPVPPRESGDAHLGTKRIFASKQRRGNGLFPNGTILVKEAQRPGKDFVGLIAVMRKERGADPAHNDWLFIEWTRESPDERFAVTARDAVCWTCHAGAEQTDYVWIYTLGIAK